MTTFKDHEKTENEMAYIHALLLDAYWAVNHTLNTRDPDVQESVCANDWALYDLLTDVQDNISKMMSKITNRPRKADGTTVHKARNISLISVGKENTMEEVE